MKLVASILFALLLLASITTVEAKIYKWVDEKGTVHFSDTPSAETAKEIKVYPSELVDVRTGISDSSAQNSAEKPSAQNPADKLPLPQINKTPIITEADYKITASVGKLGNDAISISGRIGYGPVCKNLSITARASNENGLSATISQTSSKSTSHGSTVFDGAAMVAGSRDDLSFWKIESVLVRCND